ncbi:hypothetical protein HD597_007510 [Nonomuraea thailandensis]|uniref:Uncharacterized protein n=1 Tax=Nonomuraea thailandensis TaxID=1188745 RepID=A0A9X2K5K5_9ACTN|nr:hypothetical protein [Nonomuraea thailandensis]MCP2360490.1 hypothetical protein [Nonomuraea thailandensis]
MPYWAANEAASSVPADRRRRASTNAPAPVAAVAVTTVPRPAIGPPASTCMPRAASTHTTANTAARSPRRPGRPACAVSLLPVPRPLCSGLMRDHRSHGRIRPSGERGSTDAREVRARSRER